MSKLQVFLIVSVKSMPLKSRDIVNKSAFIAARSYEDYGYGSTVFPPLSSTEYQK
jgi:hypothetical protein